MRGKNTPRLLAIEPLSASLFLLAPLLVRFTQLTQRPRTAIALVADDDRLLAIDQSKPTCNKRFSVLNICTETTLTPKLQRKPCFNAPHSTLLHAEAITTPQ
jgi:hypothetical protein